MTNDKDQNKSTPETPQMFFTKLKKKKTMETFINILFDLT